MTDRNNEKPRAIDVICYMIAAALLIPLGWWLKVNYVPVLAEWSRSWFH